MSSRSSPRLGRPGSAWSRSHGGRAELQGNRSCMLRIGERLMRAGSEGNLVQRNQNQNQTPSDRPGSYGQSEGPAPLKENPRGTNCSNDPPGNSPSRASSSSSSSTEFLPQRKPSADTSSSLQPAPRSSATLPRSSAPSAALPGSSTSSATLPGSSAPSADQDAQLDALMMTHCEVERKKEVFLEQLRKKYPQHAAMLLGQHDLGREKTRSPRHAEGGPYSGGRGFMTGAEPPDADMSEGDVLPSAVPFTRGSRERASLPTGRSSGQTRERPLGVLYLQYGEETRTVRMPSEIHSREALWALFVTAFPHQLTIKMLQSPNMTIYIKDATRNVYYNLEDIRNIPSQSCLKAYHKDPAHVFSRHAEGRISKEVLYGSHSPVHTLSSSSSALRSLQGSVSPPTVRSMPSSPSRVAYGGGASRGRAAGLGDPGSTAAPCKHLTGSGRSSSLNSSSSILERRDVKPDQDAGSSRSLALVVRGDGGLQYPDSLCSSLQDGAGGRLSISSSSQCSASPSVTADSVDSGGLGGLQQYRASVKPLLDHQTCSLHRQRSRKYSDSQLPSLGTRTPPASPHRVSEVRTEGQIIGGVGLVSSDRMSPIRRSLRRDSNGATVEIINRSRRSGSSSSTSSSVFLDSPLEPPERSIQGHGAASSTQSERIKAMEEQIASLAGLVHHALSVGPEDPVSENGVRSLVTSRHGTLSEPQDPAALSSAPPALQAPPHDSELRTRLLTAKRNVFELREQLNQLKRLQLSNQSSVSSMLRMAGQELLELMCSRLAQSQEAAQQHRTRTEEDRIHYLDTEEKILSQLSELEDHVDHLHRGCGPGPGQRSLSLREVEEAALNLRRLGEALAALKGEFPELQMKMRSALRLEVEAVRFLKDEPQKMDSMLKRVKALTDVLSSLHRRLSESARPAQVEPAKILNNQPQDSPRPQNPQDSPRPQNPQDSPRPQSPQDSPRPQSPQDSPRPQNPQDSPRPQNPQDSPRPQNPQDSPRPQNPQDSPRPQNPQDSPRPQNPQDSPRPQSPQDSPRPQNPQDSPRPQNPQDSPRTQNPQDSPRPQNPQDPPRPPRPPSPQESPKPQPRSSVRPVIQAAPVSGLEAGFVGSASPVMARRIKSTPASGVQNSQLLPSPSLTPPQGRDSPTVVKVSPRSRERSSAPQRAGLQQSEVDLFPLKPAQQRHQQTTARDRPGPEGEMRVETSTSQTSRPPSPEQTSTDLNQVLQQAQQTLMKSIPDLDVSDLTSQVPVAAAELPASSPSSPPPSSPSSPPLPAPVPERISRPHVEKPRRSVVDKELKQSSDKAGKSPPPPPPRRHNPASSVVLTGGSTERTIRIRTEPEGAQKDEGDKVKEATPSPKPKPPRQPPELKPKPLMGAARPSFNVAAPPSLDVAAPPSFPAAAPPSSRPPAASPQRPEEEGDEEEEEEEEEEDNRFLRELQVTTKLLNESHSCLGNEQKPKGKADTPPALLPANQKLSNSAACDRGSPDERIRAAGLKGNNKNILSFTSKTVTHKPVEQVPPLSREAEETAEASAPQVFGSVRGRSEDSAAPTQKQEEEIWVLRAPVSPDDVTQSPKEGVEQVFSPTTAEKKVRFTTIVTLQKENIREASPSPKQRNEKDFKDALAQKKSNMSVVGTLQREGPPEEGSVESRSACPNPPHSSRKQTPEGHPESTLNTEEGGTLSPTLWDDEGPPPPPPPVIGKFSHRKSKTGTRSQMKIHFSEQQPEDGDTKGESPSGGQENAGFEDEDQFDSKPIIVYLNEPMDIQSAYKRLSTIFESEEDLDGILSLENIVHEEDSKEEEDEQGVRGEGTQHDSPSLQDPSVPPDQQKPSNKETKRKFKFKFPKNKLASISQAIRTGTNKSGKKTLEVVVYEEEEEIGSDKKFIKDTKKQTKESKSLEIISPKTFRSDRRILTSPQKELRKNPRDGVSSLDNSLNLLQVSVGAANSPSSPSCTVSSPPQSPNAPFDDSDRDRHKGRVTREREKSPSKRPAAQILKGPNPPQIKRAKPQPAAKSSSKKQQTSSGGSSTPRSHTKSRHASSSGSPDKSSKGPPPSQELIGGKGDSGRGSRIPAMFRSSGKPSSSSLSSPRRSAASLHSSSSASTSPPASSEKPLLLSAPLHASQAPPSCSSSSSRSKKSLIPSLSLSRLLSSSSHALLPSRASSSGRHLASTTSSINSYSSSSSFSSSSSTTSSLSPTSSSSSPPSPSSSLLPSTMGPAVKALRASASTPGSPTTSRRRSRTTAGKKDSA